MEIREGTDLEKEANSVIQYQNNLEKLKQKLDSKPVYAGYSAEDEISGLFKNNKELYCLLIAVTGDLESILYNKKVIPKKRLDESVLSIFFRDQQSFHIGYLEGFLDGLTTSDFDAYAEFQKICDRFLENYEPK